MKALWLTAAITACTFVDSGVNPPPRRAEVSAPAPKPSAEASTGAAPAPGAPVPKVAPPTPPTPSSKPTTAAGHGLTATAVDLLVALDDTRVQSPHLANPNFEVLPEGKRSFANPWVSPGRGRFDRRVVWTDGARHEWALRSALTLPVPATVDWTVQVPPSGRLEADVAMGARVSSDAPVTLVARVDGTEAHREAYATGPVHKMKAWTPLSVDLSRWAGKTVTLSLEVSSDAARGYRHTAFVAAPRVTTKDAEATTGLRSPPNVLLLVVDAQRADTIGHTRRSAGRLPSLFPAMEKFVAEGVELAQAFAVGNQTRLSTYAFLAGQYPTFGGWHLGRWNYPPEVKRGYYERRPPLLTHLLRDRGYRTAAIANNLFLFGNMDVSVDMGFDELHDHRHGTLDTAWITESTIAWLDRNRERRWFLMVNYNGPHLPYLPPKEAVEALGQVGDVGYSVPYLAEVRHTDGHVAALLAHLERLGLADDTIVVLTADHGEVMDPRHQCYAENWDSNCLHNHGKTLFDEELHVPLAFRLPSRGGAPRAGATLHTPVSHVDLAPTVLGLVGAPIDSRLLGRDLSQELRDAKEPPEVPLLSEARLASAVRWRGFKYVVHDPREKIDFDSKTVYDRRRGKEELYDLVRDPHEVQNLAYGDAPCGGEGSARPAVSSCEALLEEYREKYRAIRAELKRQRGDFDMGAAPETLAADDASPPPEAAPEAATSAEKPANPASAPPAQPASPGNTQTARLHLRLHGPGKFAGVVRSEQPIGGVVVPPESQATAALRDGAVEFSGVGGDVIELRVDPNAALSLTLTRDGAPLMTSSTYAGAYGLCLLGDSMTAPNAVDITPQALEVLESPVPPVALETIPPGVFVWADAGSGAAEIRAESADDLDEEVREMMKEWGYAGK